MALYVADTRSELERLPGRPQVELWRDRGVPGRYYLFRNVPSGTSPEAPFDTNA